MEKKNIFSIPLDNWKIWYKKLTTWARTTNKQWDVFLSSINLETFSSTNILYSKSNDQRNNKSAFRNVKCTFRNSSFSFNKSFIISLHTQLLTGSIWPCYNTFCISAQISDEIYTMSYRERWIKLEMKSFNRLYQQWLLCKYG